MGVQQTLTINQRFITSHMKEINLHEGSFSVKFLFCGNHNMNLVSKSGHRIISIKFACTFLIACSGNPEQIIFFHDLLNICLIGNKLGKEGSIQ